MVLGISGYFLFTKAHMDRLSAADAIVVLGGEHDGREKYGLQLATQGYADIVLLSNPYQAGDGLMKQACSSSTRQVKVVCFLPNPGTTRGEAIFTQQMAERFGWGHVIVVTWRYHLQRTRYIFSQCFGGRATVTAVPRAYDFSFAKWESIYAYQVAGFVKAAVVGCGSSQ
ncbi:YdcF family protein [Williamsia sp. D3]|uniref:YdcF family protein n=1 Tax=Williamsia sp. D3 TaxID=1313067 RepID=UPI0003D342D7|nr:YdcF family protein [Williamsia sp. D3]ETD30520.1 hypothetical protein W823_23505 [Williamsia sp. D3]